jgi:hypothetical protein
MDCPCRRTPYSREFRESGANFFGVFLSHIRGTGPARRGVTERCQADESGAAARLLAAVSERLYQLARGRWAGHDRPLWIHR